MNQYNSLVTMCPSSFFHASSVSPHLLQLTFPRAKLLLMSTDQEGINDWYHSLCLAIG